MKISRMLGGAAVALVLSASAALAQSVGAGATGWYQPDGSSNNGSGNYFTGQEAGGEYRSFIVFTIPAGATITDAQLDIYNTASAQGGPNVLGLFDVSTGVPSLVAGTAGPAAYVDLGDGPSYGTAPAPADSVVSVTLTSAAISALNAAQGGSFAIGLVNTTIDQPDDNLFYASSPDPRNQLILTRGAAPATVPTLTEWAMLLLAGLMAGGVGLHLTRKRGLI